MVSGLNVNTLKKTISQPILWRIGGAQGHGIDSASTLFARACAKMGFHVLSHREYHSNIMGRHSYSDVRINNRPVSGYSSVPDFLIGMDAESICRHINTVSEMGSIIIDEADFDADLSRLKFLDDRLKDQLFEQLKLTNQPFTISGLLTCLSVKNLTIIKIPISSFLEKLHTHFPISRSIASRSKNIFVVAVSAAVLNIPEEILNNEISQLFASKENIIKLNQKAIQFAYDYVKTANIQNQVTLPENVQSNDQRVWINGYQSVALGKLAAGMGMQPYYPISPATDESSYLESHQTISLYDEGNVGPLIIQTEDELAAFTMACGAALTGARVSTSTSGPGFSLMVEGLGWAGMNEVPVVISLYQRGGPSTGMPTRTEQGDLQFVLHAGHGEFPRIVLASGDVTECFYDAFRVFNYAERYQLPVIHMLDKSLSSTSQTLNSFDTHNLKIERGNVVRSENNEQQRLSRFKFTPNGLSPRPLLGQKAQLFWSTGVEHAESGQVSEDPVLRRKMMDKRFGKLELALKEIPLDEKLASYGSDLAEFTLISWGSNKGVVVEAAEQLNTRGHSIRVIMVKLLWPFPKIELNKLIKKNDTIIVVECNQSGQFNNLLKEQLERESDYLILKYTGRPFMVEEITQSMKNIISGKAEKKIIHENPFE